MTYLSRRPPEELIPHYIKSVESDKMNIESADNEMKSRTLRFMGSDASQVAKQYLLLANIEEARKWFAESARYYLESKKIGDQLEDQPFTPSQALQMLYSSVLSCNRALVDKIAERITNNPPKFTGATTDLAAKEVKFLADLWLGISAEEDKVDYTRLYNKYSKRVSGYITGTLEMIIGIANNDKMTFLNGVNNYLQRFPKSGYYKELKYSLDIPMYIKLAIKRGMDIDPERDIDKKYHRYIPMGLLKAM